MSTTWTDATSFANIAAGTVDNADILPFADMSLTAGSRQRTITIETLAAVLNGVVGVNSYAGATTLDADDDRGHEVRITAAGAVTIPPDLPIGWNCVLENATVSDTVSIAAGAGVTILSAGTEISNGKVVAVVIVNTNVARVVGAFADDATTALEPGDDAATLGSGAATDGHVLTADGAGGAAWEALPGASAPTIPVIVACSDETTALTTGAAKVTFRMPFAFTLTAVRASVTTAPTGAAISIDINEGSVSVLSTKLTIDAGEKTSTTAATPAVISDSSLADDAEITIDIDTVGSTVAGAGLKVTLIGTQT